MKVFDFSHIRSIFIVGDINNLYDFFEKTVLINMSSLTKKATRRSKRVYTNSLFITTGNNKINSSTVDFEKFKLINDVLVKNNVYVAFVRGNSDDTEFFKNDILNLSNIKCIPDYSLLKANDKNILCVGGGISINRLWLKSRNELLGKSDGKVIKYYCEDEKPYYNEDAIKEIVDNKIKINAVVTHIAPTFAFPDINEKKIINWLKKDTKLLQDLKDSRCVMDMIYHALRYSTPFVWYYGHYKKDNSSIMGGVTFTSLSNSLNPYTANLDNEKEYIDFFSLKTDIPSSITINPSHFTLDFGPTIAREHIERLENPDDNVFDDHDFRFFNDDENCEQPF